MSTSELDAARSLCELENDELNRWEAKFVDDVTKILESGGSLTPKQRDVLWGLAAREL